MVLRKLIWSISIYPDSRKYWTSFKTIRRNTEDFKDDEGYSLNYDCQLYDNLGDTFVSVLANDFVHFDMSSRNPKPKSSLEFVSDYLTLFLMSENNLKNFEYAYTGEVMAHFLEIVNKNIDDKLEFKTSYDGKIPDNGKVIVVLGLDSVGTKGNNKFARNFMKIDLGFIFIEGDVIPSPVDFRMIRDYINELVCSLGKAFKINRRISLLD